MTSPDTRARQHERAVLMGDPGARTRLLGDQLRAGVKVPGIRNRIPLRPHHRHEQCDPCEMCHEKDSGHAWEDRPGDVLPWLQLRAYCGDEAAREVVPSLPGDEVPLVKSWEALKVWLTGLLRLARGLPDVAVDGPCEESMCRYKGYQDGVIYGPCDGTHSEETSAPTYLAGCVGLAVGRVCLAKKHRQFHEKLRVLERITIKTALNACERWTWCPCPANTEACRGTVVPEPQWAWGFMTPLGPFYDGSNMRTACEAASLLITPEAVREAARLMVLEVTGE